MPTNTSNDTSQVLEATKNTRSTERVFIDIIVLLSFTAISLCMVMTVGDILMRLASIVMESITGLRPKWGLFGLVDLTQLAIMTTVPLAIAVAFFLNAHIRIDLVLNLMSPFWRSFSALLSALIGATLMGICLWTAWQEMQGQLEFTTTSATLGLPYTWYWSPLIAGFALSLLACLLGVARAFGKGHPSRPGIERD